MNGFTLLPHWLSACKRSLASATLCGVLGLAGCQQTPLTSLLTPPPVLRGAAPTGTPAQSAAATPVAAAKAVSMPIQQVQGIAPMTQLPPEKIALEQPPSSKAVPINLDTVLRLAQDQNGQIGIARERLQEAFHNKNLADKAWLPTLYVGVGYYRHEGGNQNEDGTFYHSSYGAVLGGLELNGKLDLRDAVFQRVNAERKIWQRRGELAKMTNDQLLDTASTYVELLAARSGEALSLESEVLLRKLLDQAEKLEKTDPGVHVEVVRIQTELASQLVMSREARRGVKAASAKLAHLLQLDPYVDLVVMDRTMVAIQLTDPTLPVEQLIGLAQTNGPGVRELENLLNLIQDSIARTQGPSRLMPTLWVRMAEGGFGAGPGSRTEWDNRFDVGLKATWNITELCTANDRKHVANSKLAQTTLTLHDLRSKLALGVQDARETALSTSEQAVSGARQIELAREGYKLADYRLAQRIKNSSPSEVLLSIRVLGGAQLNYINTLREQNKAQLRLMLLTGTSCAHAARE